MNTGPPDDEAKLRTAAGRRAAAVLGRFLSTGRNIVEESIKSRAGKETGKGKAGYKESRLSAKEGKGLYEMEM